MSWKAELCAEVSALVRRCCGERGALTDEAYRVVLDHANLTYETLRLR
eukprot:CAMPEP_0185717136 /NCGR_PEP_ID=MMETSP1164-20130828/44230_1 /TAXON_ID=1104430 /ORGANISM="Chrysoreinhardia sp, Strain CCMP2950" /LENGTH=47 /DNA_ID= /DNA_START= /DNA_END= /DNA_ORIENTATION=